MPIFGKKNIKEVPMDADVNALLDIARKEADPAFRHKLLMRARDINPDDLAVQKAILMLGKLHEKSDKGVDFTKIKCYMLHVFEHPEKHTEEDIRSSAEELFHDPQLMLCLRLANDSRDFLEKYLTEIFGDYIRIFLAGDSSNVPSLFGIRPKHSVGRYLAKPMADIISNMMSCPYFTKEQQKLTSGLFYRCSFRFLGGEVKWLDEQLGTEVLRHLE
ncbi:MAG: hypothetical protein Q4E07_04355 [Eubacteriales bacterium]|nr:hypothetical protein [Eubacteriales bacterium]